MSVLAPGMLLLGLAVAVPLVLHLLQRQQGPRMVFPALRYLRRAEREHASRIRLRQLLLLALRILALLLLATAAARPFIGGAGAGHEPTSVVLILDNSLSSSAVIGERRVLDDLRSAALAGLEDAGPDDRFWLVRAGASWEPAVSGPADAVADAVRATEPTGATADLGAEISRARSILAAEPESRPREIHVLSDLQASNLRRLEGGDPSLVVLLVPDTPPPPNRGITAVEVGGGLNPRAGERSSLAVEITGRPATTDSVAVRLVLEAAARAVTRAPPGTAAVLPLPARQPGILSGYVEVDADAMTGDDRRYFAARVTPPPTVALAVELPFVEDALDVLEESGRIRRGPGSAADVVIAPGAAGADQVRAGRAVIVLPPATPLELAAANQRLAGAGIPWRFGTPRPGEGRLDPASSELAPALSGVRLREVYQLEPRGEDRDTTLIRLTDGESWAVSGSTDAGRYVILATPLTGEASTIPTSEAMLPLLDRAIGGWAADVPAGGGYHPGDVATLPPGDSLAAPETATPGTPGSTYRFTTPGVYRVMRDGEPVAAYAVNSPAAETDLTRLRGPQVVDALSGHVVRTAAPEDWRNAIYSERLGLEISWLLLVLALALLAVEQALAAAGARHHGARVGQNGSDRYARENAPAREI